MAQIPPQIPQPPHSRPPPIPPSFHSRESGNLFPLSREIPRSGSTISPTAMRGGRCRPARFPLSREWKKGAGMEEYGGNPPPNPPQTPHSPPFPFPPPFHSCPPIPFLRRQESLSAKRNLDIPYRRKRPSPQRFLPSQEWKGVWRRKSPHPPPNPPIPPYKKTTPIPPTPHSREGGNLPTPAAKPRITAKGGKAGRFPPSREWEVC